MKTVSGAVNELAMPTSGCPGCALGGAAVRSEVQCPRRWLDRPCVPIESVLVLGEQSHEPFRRVPFALVFAELIWRHYMDARSLIDRYVPDPQPRIFDLFF